MASTIYLVLLLLFFCMVAEAQDVEFLFEGFNGSEADLTLDRVSIIKPSGLLRLTNETRDAVGHAFYSQKIQMLNRSSSSSRNDSSFNTTFVFQIISPSKGEGGFGLAFTLSPSDRLPGAGAAHFLGLFNSTNNVVNFILNMEELDSVHMGESFLEINPHLRLHCCNFSGSSPVGSLIDPSTSPILFLTVKAMVMD